MLNYIENKIIDTDLFSGSIDTFRTAYGGYYYVTEVTTGEETDSYIEFQLADPAMPTSPYFAKVLMEGDSVTSIDENILLSNRKIPMRVYGDEDAVKNDLHWKTLWIGGSFGDVSYTPFYNQLVHSYYVAPAFLPYTKFNAKAMEEFGESPSSTVEISYDYDAYLPEYQNYINIINSELLIPSYYDLWDFVFWQELGGIAPLYSINDEEATSVWGEEFINYISLEKTAFIDFEPSCLFTYNDAKTPSGMREEGTGLPLVLNSYEIRNSYLATEYLTSSFVQHQLSSSTRDWAEDRMQNLLFNNLAVSRIHEHLGAFEDSGSMLPYKIKIQFDEYLGTESGDDPEHPGWPGSTTTTGFLDSIRLNDFSSKFIKTLYGAYSGKIGELTPSEVEYAINTQYSSASIEERYITDITTTENITFKELDYIKFLAYCYNNPLSSDEGCHFVGAQSLEIRSAIDEKGTYRHFNTEAAAAVLVDAIEFLGDTANIEVTDVEDVWGDESNLKDCRIGPLAYRIEKFKGPSTTSDSLQNFWFLAEEYGSDTSGDDGLFTFYDNQVKYNQDYTYKAYVYMAMIGYRYKFSDLALTRQLGCEQEGGYDHGLEFYNPYSADDETTNIIYSDEDTMAMLDEENVYGTDAQIFADYPYAADFYFNYEPYVKIVEMPIYTKTLKVLDNPANRLTIVPYQVAGNSQKIGFEFHTTAFVETLFPSIISDDDEEYKIDYMYAKDILEDEELVLETVAQPRYIEIYRLSERPEAVTDFEGAKLAEVDLVVEDFSQYSYKSNFYDDRIKTNQKYYYLFRVLNQQRVLSHLSEIYEAQLINDGGYKYTIFNVLYEHDLEQEVFNNPSKNFKKIFQLQPNLDQLQFVVDELDFDESALSQIDNLEVGLSEDSIWDKTFKIRLTSKKTGRKIDLNITYRLNSD